VRLLQQGESKKERKNETLSDNNFCRRTPCVLHILGVSLYSLPYLTSMQNASATLYSYFHLRPVWMDRTFHIILRKAEFSGGGGIEHEMTVLILLKSFVSNIFHSKKK